MAKPLEAPLHSRRSTHVGPPIYGAGLKLGVRSDSRAALSSALRLASTSADMNDVACEIALDVATEKVSIAFAAHVRGEDNVDADALSRIFAPSGPGGAYTIPARLAEVARSHPPPFVWKADGPAALS